MSRTKKALLDTDFLFKTQLAQNSQREPLADLVMAFQGYEFFCHEKIREELKTHSFMPDPVPWLEDRIEEGIIRCYSDKDILEELNTMFGNNASDAYFDMLKRSCDAYKNSFFTNWYQPLIDLPDHSRKVEFLTELASCDSMIPNGNSMGENKSFVLAQLLQLKYPGEVVILCSDDNGARQRVSYIDSGIKCLSVLSVFQKLMSDGLDKAVSRQYFDSLCSFYSLHRQTGMKVWKHESSERINVDFGPLFEDIYSGKFEIKGTGDLRYKE